MCYLLRTLFKDVPGSIMLMECTPRSCDERGLGQHGRVVCYIVCYRSPLNRFCHSSACSMWNHICKAPGRGGGEQFSSPKEIMSVCYIMLYSCLNGSVWNIQHVFKLVEDLLNFIFDLPV